ncbi:hypothetical protein HDU97_002950 [Phlyctochytrium planicorne]|nr:hypothetical protein HDU97_002950 [Phlyctochytrium planicorne]
MDPFGIVGAGPSPSSRNNTNRNNNNNGYVNLNKNFVRRSGSSLVVASSSDSSKLYRFRFVSFNTPNLHWNEDSNPPEVPAAWEQADALRSLAMIGCRVTRTYVLSIVPKGWNTTDPGPVPGPYGAGTRGPKVLAATSSSTKTASKSRSTYKIDPKATSVGAKVRSEASATVRIASPTSISPSTTSSSQEPFFTPTFDDHRTGTRTGAVSTPPRRHIANLDPSTLDSTPPELRPPGTWTLVPGTADHRIKLSINEDLFAGLDMAIAQAGVHGVRIILPFIDHWQWWGGVEDFTAYYGKPKNAFYTDEEIILGFEALVSHVVQRVNTVTGVKYSDDPSILAWETGNELGGYEGYKIPAAWTGRIARTIKAVDGNHLVSDGGYQVNGWEDAVLADQMVDMHSGHYYSLPAGFVPQTVVRSGRVGAGFVGGGVGGVVAGVAVLGLVGLGLRRAVKGGKRQSREVKVGGLEIERAESGVFLVNEGKEDMKKQDEKKSLSVLAGKVSEGVPESQTWYSNMFKFVLPAIGVSLLIALIAFLTITVTVTMPRKENETREKGFDLLADQFSQDIQRVVTTYNKPYFVGEFGLQSLNTLVNFMDRVSQVSSGASGIMVWSLRFRSAKAGFYTHNEGGSYFSYHFPGFPSTPITGSAALYPHYSDGKSGFDPDEASFVKSLQDHSIASYIADNQSPLSLTSLSRAAENTTARNNDLGPAFDTNPFFQARPQPAPEVLGVKLLGGTVPPAGWPDGVFNTFAANGTAAVGSVGTVWLSWKGSSGAKKYLMEVSDVDGSGPFVVVSQDVLDNVLSGDGIVQVVVGSGGPKVDVVGGVVGLTTKLPSWVRVTAVGEWGNSDVSGVVRIG